jgi:glycosyltransferase involved in cell wall biosynthesis
VLDQLKMNYEIICINDGSKDKTLFNLIQYHKQNSVRDTDSYSSMSYASIVSSTLPQTNNKNDNITDLPVVTVAFHVYVPPFLFDLDSEKCEFGIFGEFNRWNPNEMKKLKIVKKFKENVLNNKQVSKLYSVYDQLSQPQGLNQVDAEHYLNEGLNLIEKILPSVKMPSSTKKSENNLYSDIDTLVYTNKLNLKERIQSRKNILNVLMSEPKKITEGIKIPVSSMVKIANLTLENYIKDMDSESKKIFIDVIKGDKENMEKDYSTLKEGTIDKLKTLFTESEEGEIKSKISETIEKLQKEEFNQINYVKLISLKIMIIQEKKYMMN